MSLWTDIRDEVYTLTTRNELQAETDLAIRQAIRTAHKSGKYWRDLVTVTVTPGNETIQNVDLSNEAPRMRQVAYLKVVDQEIYFNPVDISDLLDADGMTRINVYWGMGSNLKIRGESAYTSYELCYYQYPVVSPQDSLSSWIADEHRDLIVLWAASTVLGITGEQEIKSRIDQLAALAFADLQQDNLEVQGR